VVVVAVAATAELWGVLYCHVRTQADGSGRHSTPFKANTREWLSSYDTERLSPGSAWKDRCCALFGARGLGPC